MQDLADKERQMGDVAFIELNHKWYQLVTCICFL